MFSWIKEWIFRRRLKPIEDWKLNTINILVNKVLPEHAPFQYDVVLSFLQIEGFNPKNPIRLDLLLPDYPLAIDFIGPQHNSSYRIASRYISKTSWENLQEQLSIKKQMFASYGCPYMMLTSDEARDARSIAEKVRAVIGHYLE